MAFLTQFHFTGHAKQRAEQRGITEKEFLDAVLHHEKKTRQKRGVHGGFVHLFEKQVGNRRLFVAAELYKDNCYFLTGYWQ